MSRLRSNDCDRSGFICICCRELDESYRLIKKIMLNEFIQCINYSLCCFCSVLFGNFLIFANHWWNFDNNSTWIFSFKLFTSSQSHWSITFKSNKSKGSKTKILSWLCQQVANIIVMSANNMYLLLNGKKWYLCCCFIEYLIL